MVRCTLVEPVVRGFVWVKFEDEKERHKLWLKSYEQCGSEAAITFERDGMRFCRCTKHGSEAR